MRYQIHEHRHALNLFTTDQEFVPLYQEIVDVLDGISDEDVIAEYNANHREVITTLNIAQKLLPFFLRSRLLWPFSRFIRSACYFLAHIFSARRAEIKAFSPPRPAPLTFP